MAKRREREAPSDKRFRDALPKQVSGRVTVDTFDRIEALRDTLKTHTGELIRLGAEALIANLPSDDRRYFNESLARIRKRRQQLDADK